MENIHLEVQGVKGGNTKSQKAGYLLVCLRQNQDRITIDDYEGFGDTYKQRELQKIEVIENGKILFSGSKYDLFSILKNHNK